MAERFKSWKELEGPLLVGKWRGPCENEFMWHPGTKSDPWLIISKDKRCQTYSPKGFCQPPPWGWKWTFPKNLQRRPSQAETLISALWDPKHGSHLSPPRPDLPNFELINKFCFKPLTLWQFEMKQRKTYKTHSRQSARNFARCMPIPVEIFQCSKDIIYQIWEPAPFPMWPHLLLLISNFQSPYWFC